MKPNLQRLPVFVFSAYIVLLFASIFLSLYYEKYYILAIPFIVIVGHLAMVDTKKIFLLLLTLLPLSVEFHFENGLGTDLPTEPLMVLLMLIFIISVVFKPATFDRNFLKEPVIQLLMLHVIWIVISVIYSSHFLYSVKFLLAKLWYVITFVFLAAITPKKEKAE